MQKEEIKKTVEIDMDIFCVWYKQPPAYRIYIDDELMAERTFLGTPDEYYQEHIIVEVTPGTHRIVFERLPVETQEDRVNVTHIKIDGKVRKFGDGLFFVDE